jgi:hypothetical protein
MNPTYVIDSWTIELRHYPHGADTPVITFAAHYDTLDDIAADYGTWVTTCDPDRLLGDLAEEAAVSWMDSNGDHDTDDDGPWNTTVWGPNGQYVLWTQDFDRWHEHQAEKRVTCAAVRPRRRTRPARSYRRYRTLVPAQ